MSILENNQDGKTENEIEIALDSEEGERLHTAVLVLLLFLLVSFAAFALGKLSAKTESSKGLTVETVAPDLSENKLARPPVASTSEAPAGASNKEAPFLVGSRNSDKYHFPWCSGAKRINAENTVSFASYEEARKAGYVPAQNCEGLE